MNASRLTLTAAPLIAAIILVSFAAPSVAGGLATIQPFGSPPQPLFAPDAVDTDIAVHGTAWVAETPKQLSLNRAYGWGLAVRKKLPGSVWFHISIPYTTYLENRAQYISQVTFCGKSTNGAAVKADWMDLWEENASRFWTQGISWPASGAYDCRTVYPGNVWKHDLGLSVRVVFNNTTDTFTFMKAWVRIHD